MQNKIKVNTPKPTIRKEISDYVKRAKRNLQESVIYVECTEYEMWGEYYNWSVEAHLYIEGEFISTWTWKDIDGLTTEEELDNYTYKKLMDAISELAFCLAQPLADEWCTVKPTEGIQYI